MNYDLSKGLPIYSAGIFTDSKICARFIFADFLLFEPFNIPIQHFTNFFDLGAQIFIKIFWAVIEVNCQPLDDLQFHPKNPARYNKNGYYPHNKNARVLLQYSRARFWMTAYLSNKIKSFIFIIFQNDRNKFLMNIKHK